MNLTKEELIIGNIYYFKYETQNYIFQLSNINKDNYILCETSIYYDDDCKRKEFNNYELILSSMGELLNLNNTFRLATLDEIKWLRVCDYLNRYIDFEKVFEHSINFIENDEINNILNESRKLYNL